MQLKKKENEEAERKEGRKEGRDGAGRFEME